MCLSFRRFWAKFARVFRKFTDTYTIDDNNDNNAYLKYYTNFFKQLTSRNKYIYLVHECLSFYSDKALAIYLLIVHQDSIVSISSQREVRVPCGCRRHQRREQRKQKRNPHENDWNKKQKQTYNKQRSDKKKTIVRSLAKGDVLTNLQRLADLTIDICMRRASYCCMVHLVVYGRITTVQSPGLYCVSSLIDWSATMYNMQRAPAVASLRCSWSRVPVRSWWGFVLLEHAILGLVSPRNCCNQPQLTASRSSSS